MATKGISLTPNKALIEWARVNRVNPAQLAKATGFSYSYAWSLLNGDKPVTVETFGRLAVAFGSDSLRDVEAALKVAQADGQAGR